MKTILYDSPFVPPEWIAAHGLTPRRLSALDGSSLSKAASGLGVCPYAQQFLGALSSPEIAGGVFTTSCDQMRRAADLAAGDATVPVFLFNLPATWQTSSARELYRSELDRLGRFLTSLGGPAPSAPPLAAVMRAYAAARSGLLKARDVMSSRAFSEALARLSPTDSCPVPSLPTPDPAVLKATPVAWIGGPLLRSHYPIFDLVEAAGGRIALDATRGGEGSLASPFDELQLESDPVSALVEAYFDGVPDAFRRPNEPFYRWLKAMVLERGIRGILLWHYVWCDLWHAEEQRLREVTGLPVLRLEVGEESQPLPHTINRVQSFLEMLR